MSKKKMRHTRLKRQSERQQAPTRDSLENVSGPRFLATLAKTVADKDEELYQTLRQEVLQIVEELDREISSIEDYDRNLLDSDSSGGPESQTSNENAPDLSSDFNGKMKSLEIVENVKSLLEDITRN